MPKIYVVGDSTLAKFNDKSYLFPRFGYGTKLDKYFNIEVVNLALSGRSSLSFLSENNYQYLLDNIKNGDYLIIGFGHNDEKSDDVKRFTSAKTGLEDEKSFISTTYYRYVVPALERGATPIIATPVSRITRGNYEGNIIHDTENGNYSEALIKLGKEKNILVIDLTKKTKELYLNIGYDKTCYHHAITSAYDFVNGEYKFHDNAVDKTHLSEYGADMVAYLFYLEIMKSNSDLKEYAKNANMPTEADIKYNPEYKFIKYKSPALDDKNKLSNDLYYTTLGSVKSFEGFSASKEDNKFILRDLNKYGKVVFSSTAGIFLFKQLNRLDNFKATALLKVLGDISSTEAAFGLMIRDDCYLDSNNNLASNEILCGLLNNNGSCYLNYDRCETTSINRDINISNYIYRSGDEIECEITRLGQRINLKLKYLDKIYEREYLDFDLFGIDNDYFYVGIFNAKNEIVEVSDFKIDITSKAMEA